MSKWFDENGTDIDAYPDRAFKGGVYEPRKALACNCEFCRKCSHCGHKADEHMAGDLESGICFMCQREGKKCRD